MQVHPYAGNRRMLLTRDITSLEQAEAMRRDFVANVSHEIRTPLTVLAGFVETLQNLPLDAPRSGRATWPDGAAVAPHGNAGQRPADPVAAGGQRGPAGDQLDPHAGA